MPVPSDWPDRFKRAKTWLEQSLYPGDILAPFVFDESVETPDDYLAWVGELEGRWCFRGHREANWVLQTAFDRAVREQTPNGEFNYHPTRLLETDAVEAFRNEFAYTPSPLSSDAGFSSLLAAMQHLGIPTRLLDCTHSPLVALYFATEQPSLVGPSAVWAIDLEWIESNDARIVGLENASELTAAMVNRLLLDRTERAAIIHVAPDELPKRMAAQHGLFLGKLVDDVNFAKVLVSMLYNSPQPERPVVRKVRIPAQARARFMKSLKGANITMETLFPQAELDPPGLRVREELSIRIKESIVEVRAAWERVGERLHEL